MPDICTFIPQIIGGAVSAAIGGFIGYFSARRIGDRNARATAGAKLRAAFAPAQVKLSMPRELGNVEAREYFGEAFLAHAAAIEEFRPFASDRSAYQRAYDEYREALFADDSLGDAKLRWDSGKMINEHGDSPLDFLNVIDERIKAILNQA